MKQLGKKKLLKTVEQRRFVPFVLCSVAIRGATRAGKPADCGAELLRHCLQQQRGGVPHRAGLQVLLSYSIIPLPENRKCKRSGKNQKYHKVTNIGSLRHVFRLKVFKMSLKNVGGFLKLYFKGLNKFLSHFLTGFRPDQIQIYR